MAYALLVYIILIPLFSLHCPFSFFSQKSEYEWASLPKENTDVDEDWDDSSLIQGRSLSNVELDIIRRRSSSSPISTDLLAHPPPLPPGPKRFFDSCVGFFFLIFPTVSLSIFPSVPFLFNELFHL